MQVKSIEEFETLLTSPPSKEKAIFVKFSIPGCQPCKDAVPFLQEQSKEWEGKILFLSVEAKETPEILEFYGTNAYPTFLTFKAGETVPSASFPPLIGWSEKLAEKYKAHLKKVYEEI